MDRSGQSIGHYKLLRLLGHGGFADVYLGEHVHLQRLVAIKILHTRLTSDMQAGFFNEARILAKLSHPHIIQVFDFGLDDNNPFLVMEYASHGNLRQLHPRLSRLPLTTVVHYVEAIADALQYAHEHKLIHRDLKPDNILIGSTSDQDEKLLVGDFGVALFTQTGYVSGTKHGFAGTALYAAPEQALGKPVFASDQYALAVMVYEWLCGLRPFEGTLFELYTQHQHKEPDPLRHLSPSLAPEVEQVVLRALQKDPAQRFPTIKAFALALAAAACQNDTLPDKKIASTDMLQLMDSGAAPSSNQDDTLPANRIISPVITSSVSSMPTNEQIDLLQSSVDTQSLDNQDTPVLAASSFTGAKSPPMSNNLVISPPRLKRSRRMLIAGFALCLVLSAALLINMVTSGGMIINFAHTSARSSITSISTSIIVAKSTTQSVSTPLSTTTENIPTSTPVAATLTPTTIAPSITATQPPVTPSLTAQPAPTSTPIPQSAPVVTSYSFEDGTTQRWEGDFVTQLVNSTNYAKDGSHALKVFVQNTSSNVVPLVYTNTWNDKAPMPHAGQTITAYIYLPNLSGTSSQPQSQANIFVEDSNSVQHFINWNAISVLPFGSWQRLTYTIPADVHSVVEYGIGLNTPSTTGQALTAYIDLISWG